ncbi:hypothetical protein DW083_06815 [Parabacteroides sp. AF48-14]|uniref:Arm DNA-binding domain-containing protein n=1 Tax=Parabacteroides sp. AF48-14 TaxID=2292052 RepID=UPI000EFECDBA|nr:Arm DNA-binding domain-containing protein [Parabacteroides sp. AF48-14]RHO73302.1 hypothetical protein DW083_06815 [Parabacteroides sp. AF48-14]
MSTTISVVCYKSKVLKNNESPLMLRVCKDRKMKYESLGISLNPKYWDFKANKPTAKCPNREYIEKLIAEKKRAYADKVIELKAMANEFTEGKDLSPYKRESSIIWFCHMNIYFCRNK